MKNINAIPVYIFRILIIIIFYFSELLCLSYMWLISKWGEVSVDEILFQLSANLKGASEGLVNSYVIRALVPSLIILFIVFAVFLYLKRRNLTIKKHSMILLLLSGVLLGSTVAHAWNRISLGFYLKGLFSESSFIADNYVNPDSVKITFPEKKRNLICIYLESMELAFMDKENGGVYSENTIPELTRTGKESEMFISDGQINGGNSLYGSGYTMGALVATTSGLPIRMDIELSNMNSIYPDITVLGDILADNGYTQVFSCGSEAGFGGRKAYFENHGNYIIHDYVNAEETGRIDKGYYTWWGFEDEKLYEFAKEDLLELAEKGEPFNYTMLTVDTHFEDGYICRLCHDDFGNDQYRNVINCADRQVTEFIEWIKQQDFYENTTILVTGDHPSMDKTIMDITPPDYTRKTFTCYINAAKEYTGSKREYSTMDLFPTTIASIGGEIDGDRLGLGVNLFSDRKTLIEESSISYVNNELNASSDLMYQLLGFSDADKKMYSGYSFNSFYDPYSDQLYISVEGSLMESESMDQIRINITDEKGEETEGSAERYGETKLFRSVIPLHGLGEDLYISISPGNDRDEETGDEYHRRRQYLLFERTLSDYADLINNLTGCTVLIAKQGNIGDINDWTEESLERIGINVSEFCRQGAGYCAVIENGILTEKTDDDRCEYSGMINNDNSFYISSDMKYSGSCSIAVNEKECSENRDGINIVICDSATGEVISAASFDLTDLTDETSLDHYVLHPEKNLLPVSVYNIRPGKRETLTGGFARVSDREKAEWREFPLEVYDESENTLIGTLDLNGYDPENIIIDFFWTDDSCGCYYAGRIEGNVR